MASSSSMLVELIDLKNTAKIKYEMDDGVTLGAFYVGGDRCNGLVMYIFCLWCLLLG